MKILFQIILLFLFICECAYAQSGPNIPISQMPNGGTLQPTDMMHVSRCNYAGCDYRVNTVGTLAAASIPLAVNFGGSGSSNPSLVQGTGITISGSWPNQTITNNAPSSPGGSGGQIQYNNNGAFGGITFGATSPIVYNNGIYSCPTCNTSSANVTSFTGDSALITNSGSTGAVTITLGTAAPNTVWGNNTGSSARPGYQSMAVQQLPVYTRATSAVITMNLGGL